MSDSGLFEWERFVCTLYDTRDQLKRHIFDRADEAFSAGDMERDRIRTAEQLNARKAQMRRLFLQAIGGLPRDSGSLNARTAGEVQCSGYKIEKVMYESRPGHDVTANLYLPQLQEAAGPAVLFLCGHEREAKHSAMYQSVCIRLAQAGLIVLAVDPIGQGERLSYISPQVNESDAIWGTQEHQHAGAQCLPLGEGLARYFLHDAIRSVDYLSSRPEVDPGRIGVTGNSGGGTQTAMLMLCDDRIAAAAPGTFIMNRQMYMHAGGVQDAEQVWPGLTAAGFDHEDVLLAFAPKPLVVLACKYDFFPIEATRRTVERCRRFWAMHGRSDCLLLAEDESLHRYTARLAETAAAFFSEHLLKRPYARPDAAPQTLPAEALLCTRSGQVKADRPDARTVRDENAACAARLAHDRSLLPADELREHGRSWLRGQVFASRRSGELNPRRIALEAAAGFAGEYLLWWSQSGVMNSGMAIRSTDRPAEERPPLTVAVWEGGTTALDKHRAWLNEACAAGRTVLMLNTSGTGPLAPHPIYGKHPLRFFGVMHKLADELLWLGDSLAAMRIYDVIRCLDLIEELQAWEEEPVDFYTAGRTNLYVRLAAALDSRIGRIAEAGPLASVSGWVSALEYEEEEAMSYILPGMLRYFDLADL